MLFFATLPALLALGYVLDLFDGGQDPVALDDDAPDFNDTIGRDDDLLGTDLANQIDLGAGNDRVDAGNGPDWVAAGPGNDEIRLGSGRDYARADIADLQWRAHSDPDNAEDYAAQIAEVERQTYAGDDSYFGNYGDDLIIDSLGNDQMHGGYGDDQLMAWDVTQGAADRLEGGAGDDRIFADDGDTITAGDGSDQIILRYDPDTDAAPITITDFDPQTAPDQIYVYSEAGTPLALRLIEDGPDSLLLADDTPLARLQGLQIDDAPAALPQQIFADHLLFRPYSTEGGDFIAYTSEDWQTLRDGLGSGNDTVIGSDGPQDVSLDAGDDLFHGNGGDDEIHSGSGDDTVLGGAGNDWINGDAGSNHLEGGPGDDYLEIRHSQPDLTGHSTLVGGDGDDLLRIYTASAEAFGGAGDDYIYDSSSSAASTLHGEAGNDSLWGSAGDTLSGGNGDDIFGVIVTHPGAAPVVLRDYDPTAREELRIVVDTGPFGSLDNSALSYAPTANGSGLIVHVGDHAVALLEGITDPGDLRIQVNS